MREGRVLPQADSGDFWDRMVGYGVWFTAGVVFALVYLDMV